MKTSELTIKNLMIGDWVVINNIPRQITFIDACINYKIIAVGKHQDGSRVSYVGKLSEEVKPIPLTPEILEKNGFVLESYSGNVMSGKWWTRNDFVIHKNMNDSVGKNNFKYEYVHQLQHALRLCGIEKEIIL